MSDERTLSVVSVRHEDGLVGVWMLPSWLKGDRIFPARLTPKLARKLAVQLLQAAEGAEES